MLAPYQQKGLGIVEVMMVIALAAIAIVMATRYFAVASDGQKQVEAVRAVGDITDAARTYAKRRDFSAGSLTMDKLVDMGLLNKRFKTNPWGGETKISASKKSNTWMVKIELQKVPYASCALMKQQIESTQVSASSGTDESVDNCAKKGGIVIWNHLF